MGDEWRKAHEICQTKEGDPGHDLVHALAHWIEGDDANARYWYNRVGGGRAATIEEEWQRIAAKLLDLRRETSLRHGVQPFVDPLAAVDLDVAGFVDQSLDGLHQFRERRWKRC